jgi:hypothetical protein
MVPDNFVPCDRHANGPNEITLGVTQPDQPLMHRTCRGIITAERTNGNMHAMVHIPRSIAALQIGARVFALSILHDARLELDQHRAGDRIAA